VATTLTLNGSVVGGIKEVTIIEEPKETDDVYYPIHPENFSFECDIPNDGHFEGGAWITPLWPVLDYLRETGKLNKPELFEVKEKYIEFIFKNGAAVGVTFHERILGNFTKEEILHQFVDANKMIKWW
jgi:hypothetical protein